MNIISIGFPQALIPIIEREWEATVRGDSDCIEFLASSREGGFYNYEFKLCRMYLAIQIYSESRS